MGIRNTVFLVPIILGCLGIGCTSNQRQLRAENCLGTREGEFEVLKTLAINTEGRQYESPSNHILETDSGTLLATFDRQMHKIDFYSMENGNWIRATQMANDGPNEVSEPSSFYYHNQDSIFITKYGCYQLYLMNVAGELINTWNFFDTSLPDSLHLIPEVIGTYGLCGFDEYGIQVQYDLKSKSLLVYPNILVSEEDNSFPYTYQLPFLARFDLTTEKVFEFFGKYPESYLGESIPHDMFLSFVEVDGRVVVSFPSSQELMVFKKSESSGVCAASNYIKNKDFYWYDYRDGGEVDDFWNQYIASASYDRILYNKYEKCYYRIAKHSIPEISADGLRNKRESSSWSIIVLNKELVPTKEVKFPAKKYDFSNLHIIRDGLLISRNNILSDDFNEDKILFDLVSLN